MDALNEEVVFPVRTTAGEVLTETDVEALAAEAEVEYDLSNAKRQYLGRPSLDTGVSPRVSFRVTRVLFDAARIRAEHEGRTVSELAREAMEQYLRD